jgi:hypothetical protein
MFGVLYIDTIWVPVLSLTQPFITRRRPRRGDPLEGGNDPLSEYCCMLLQLSQTNVKRPEALASSEGIRGNTMARRLERTVRICTGGVCQ